MKMSKTDDYIVEKHNEELEEKTKEELKREELERELRYDIYFG